MLIVKWRSRVLDSVAYQAFVIRSPVMLSLAWLSTFIGAAFALAEGDRLQWVRC